MASFKLVFGVALTFVVWELPVDRFSEDASFFQLHMHMLWGRSFEWKGKYNPVSSVSIQCVSSCYNWITCQGEVLILDVAIWSTGVYGDRTERDKASDNECIRADLSFTWTQPIWPFWNTTGVSYWWQIPSSGLGGWNYILLSILILKYKPLKLLI